MPEEGEDDVCPAQTNALLNVGFLGIMTQVTSPLLGWIADHYGAPALVNIMAVTCWIGLSLMLVAAETGLDRLFYVAFSCLGLTTMMGVVLMVQTGLYFTGRTRRRVISALNALFDAGSITYLGLWGIGEGTGASLGTITGGYLVLAVIAFGGGAYFWNFAIPDKDLEEEGDMTKKAMMGHYDTTGHNERESGAVKGPSQSRLETDLGDPPAPADHDAASPKPESTKDTKPREDITTSDDLDDDKPKRYIRIAERSSRQQLTSEAYILLVVFFSLHNCGGQWNLSTQRDFLASLGDDDAGNKYLTIFTLLMPASVVGLPFVDAVVTYFGFIGGLQVVNLLGLAYTIIKVRRSMFPSEIHQCVRHHVLTHCPYFSGIQR
jgi:hypothetical protein